MRKLTIDYLAAIDDYELEKHLRRMQSVIRSTRGGQKQSAEIELCYVQRELDIRKRRHKVHKEYLDELTKRKNNFYKRRA